MLVSAAISRGPPHRLLVLWARGRFELAVSQDLLYELQAVLLRPYFRRKLSYEEILEYVMWLRERAASVVERQPLESISSYTADPDDDYLVDLALSASADVLVSSDGHLTRLEDPPASLRVLTPRAFLTELDRESRP